MLQAWCPGRIPPSEPTAAAGVAKVAVKESRTMTLSASDIQAFEATGRWHRCC